MVVWCYLFDRGMFYLVIPSILIVKMPFGRLEVCGDMMWMVVSS